MRVGLPLHLNAMTILRVHLTVRHNACKGTRISAFIIFTRILRLPVLYYSLCLSVKVLFFCRYLHPGGSPRNAVMLVEALGEGVSQPVRLHPQCHISNLALNNNISFFNLHFHV